MRCFEGRPFCLAKYVVSRSSAECQNPPTNETPRKFAYKMNILRRAAVELIRGTAIFYRKIRGVAILGGMPESADERDTT